jgi:hypothetical protein
VEINDLGIIYDRYLYPALILEGDNSHRSSLLDNCPNNFTESLLQKNITKTPTKKQTQYGSQFSLN